MVTTRPDVPVSIRDVAKLAGVAPRTMKARLQRRARHTGERLLFALTPGGKLYTTLGACRGAFGETFGRVPTDHERLEALEGLVKKLRLDLNASAVRHRKLVAFVTKLTKHFGAAEQGGLAPA